MNIWFVIFTVEIVIIVFLIWMVWSVVVGAPWLPTPKSKVRAMLEFANVGEGDTLYDLGSGDGRILIMAAKEFGAKAVGIEADPLRQRKGGGNRSRSTSSEVVEVDDKTQQP